MGVAAAWGVPSHASPGTSAALGKMLQPFLSTWWRVHGSCPRRGTRTGNTESQEANTRVITGTIVRLRLVV